MNCEKQFRQGSRVSKFSCRTISKLDDMVDEIDFLIIINSIISFIRSMVALISSDGGNFQYHQHRKQ